MNDGPKEGLRMSSALRRRAGTTRDEFRRHWAEVHAPLGLAHPEVFGIGRYVQMHTPDDAESYAPALVRGAPAPFDGFAEVYYRTGFRGPLRLQSALTLGFQFIRNPGYNADRGPVRTVAARFHTEF